MNGIDFKLFIHRRGGESAEKDQGLVGFAQKKNNRCSSNALRLISLSEIKFQAVKLTVGDSAAYFTGQKHPPRPLRLERSGR